MAAATASLPTLMDRDPVGVTDGEARPARKIKLRIDTERSGGGMRHRHLGEAAHHNSVTPRGKKVTEDDAGPGGPNRQRAAQEQASADGASDRHHADLALLSSRDRPSSLATASR